jgi:uncharacterized protein YciI
LFVVMMKYLVEFELDDPRVEAHRQFLRDQATAGRVVVSGPRVPRVGGLTVFNVESQDELQELLAQDAMRKAGMIEDEIVEFTATVAAHEEYLDSSPVRS